MSGALCGNLSHLYNGWKFMEVSTSELRATVEKMHNCTARLVGLAPVSESVAGKPVWEGLVHVFALERHPSAERVYAWSSSIEGSSNRRFVAVLHTPQFASPADAVRASIMAERQATEPAQ